MRTKKRALLLMILASGWFPLGCNGVNSLIEQARFALDRCNPTLETSLTNCQAAVDDADEVQTTDPTNLEAASVEASGYLGLARLDFLTFAADLSDLGNNAEGDFAEFRTFVSDYETDLNTDQETTGLAIDLDNLQAAKDSFGDLLEDVEVGDDGIAIDETARQASFQLGVIQALDAFIRPVKIAGEAAADVADIDDTVTAAVLADFLDADNNLVVGGTTEEESDDLLRPVRENYCRCSLNGGLTTNCLQDLMRCELNPDAADETGDNGGVEQDYNGDGDANDADCATLLSPDGLDACGGTDTSS